MLYYLSIKFVKSMLCFWKSSLKIPRDKTRFVVGAQAPTASCPLLPTSPPFQIELSSSTDHSLQRWLRRQKEKRKKELHWTNQISLLEWQHSHKRLYQWYWALFYNSTAVLYLIIKQLRETCLVITKGEASLSYTIFALSWLVCEEEISIINYDTESDVTGIELPPFV